MPMTQATKDKPMRILAVPKVASLLSFFMAALLIAALIRPAAAQTDTAGGQAPIDISADRALEWDRGNARYIARGNARASQGETTILADVLTALYDPADDGGTDLTEIHAENAVQIINGESVIFGDRAVYDLLTEQARVTGEDLRLVSETLTVTATDYFAYDARAETVTAEGNALVIEGDKKLESARLIAYLGQDAAGKTIVERLEAPAPVTITTAEETAVGSRGRYDVKREIATLEGDVRITQEQNQLEGARAEVNMKTGKSRLFAAENEQGLPGRVRGIFYPKSGEETP